ncbi:hypothetical protein MKW94_004603 [Papaver nudicaule]|uniref:Uncharacterized protein n=1 Tax=Papaver nudicaule TaxID=74823 RepID=A0AA41VN84_PAPNU|nr:hypothetical protein [Papaver nudicaule]
MNQISRFCVCRSLLRRNPFTRWSSKPISSSSLISNNPTSSNLMKPISKFHHTFNYPPQIFSIPGNRFRKFSGEPAAECDFDVDYLNDEIFKVQSAIVHARSSIETGTLSAHDAVKTLSEEYNALLEKLGRHRQQFMVKIVALEDEIDFLTAIGEQFQKYGGSWRVFEDLYRAGGMYVGEFGSDGIAMRSFRSDLGSLHTLPMAQAMFEEEGHDDTNADDDENLLCGSQMELKIRSKVMQMRMQSYKMGQAEGDIFFFFWNFS